MKPLAYPEMAQVLQYIAMKNPLQSKMLDPRGGTEGAIGYGGGSSAPRYVVAGKLKDGTVVYGRPGDIHSDLANPWRSYAKVRDLDDIKEMGFARGEGMPFLTRGEAAKGIGSKTPLQAETYERSLGNKKFLRDE
jgi:hypothetical protein